MATKILSYDEFIADKELNEGLLSSILDFFQGIFDLFSDKKVKKYTEKSASYIKQIEDDENIEDDEIKNKFDIEKFLEWAKEAQNASISQFKKDTENVKEIVKTESNLEKILSSWLAMIFVQQESTQLHTIEKMLKNNDMRKRFTWVPKQFSNLESRDGLKKWHTSSECVLDDKIAQGFLEISKSDNKKIKTAIQKFSRFYVNHVVENHENGKELLKKNDFEFLSEISRGFAIMCISITNGMSLTIKNTSKEKLTEIISEKIVEKRKRAPKKKDDKKTHEIPDDAHDYISKPIEMNPDITSSKENDTELKDEYNGEIIGWFNKIIDGKVVHLQDNNKDSIWGITKKDGKYFVSHVSDKISKTEIIKREETYIMQLFDTENVVGDKKHDFEVIFYPILVKDGNDFKLEKKGTLRFVEKKSDDNTEVNTSDDDSVERSDLPETQTNTRTKATRKILDFFANKLGINKFNDDLSNGTYISWLQKQGDLGHKVAELLHSPKRAFDLINDETDGDEPEEDDIKDYDEYKKNAYKKYAKLADATEGFSTDKLTNDDEHHSVFILYTKGNEGIFIVNPDIHTQRYANIEPKRFFGKTCQYKASKISHGDKISTDRPGRVEYHSAKGVWEITKKAKISFKPKS